MLKNYFKTAIRHLFKNKIYLSLNVLGLAIGMASALLLFFYVQHELSYDKFHLKGDRIYRVLESFKNGDAYTTTALSPYKIAPLLAENHPGVESYVRIDGTVGRRLVKFGENEFSERSIIAVDSTFFEIFDFKLLQGDEKTALLHPNTVVIGDDIARKYFGEEDPLGKVLTFTDQFDGSSMEMKVTGVMKKMPENSHFHRDFLLSMKTADIITPNRMDSWGWTSQYSYVLLKKGQNVSKVEPLLADLKKEHAPEWFNEWAYFSMQPMLDIHLKSEEKDEIEAQGDMTYVSIFSIIAFFLILIACINYMNLATARSAERGKEVGLRKVVGADKKQLVGQFLGESMIISVMALLLGLMLFQLALPFFEQVSGKALSVNFFNSPSLLTGALGLALFIGLISGSYPAFVVSRFQPIQALKDNFSSTNKNIQAVFLRKGLVAFQFVLSITLIVGTIVIYQQWQFMQNKKLGVNADQVLTMRVSSQQMLDEYEVFKKELLKVPGVNNVSASNYRPATVFASFNSFLHGGEKHTLPVVAVKYDFFKTYEIPMVDGRAFSQEFGSDTAAIILNEAGIAALGLENPVGTRLNYGSLEEPDWYEVVGVAKDVHFESLRKAINPHVYVLTENWVSYLAANVNTNNLSSTLSGIQDTWGSFPFIGDFSYQFLNENVQRQYQAESQFFQVFSIFSALAIFIACLGLFGLASYTTQLRTKEIGIRKVLGATVLDVLFLLNKEFGKLILLAFIIAIPLSYFVMNKWLQGFAYSIKVGIGIFILTAVLVALVAVLTVSYQSLKAAVANPVDSLKYE